MPSTTTAPPAPSGMRERARARGTSASSSESPASTSSTTLSALRACSAVSAPTFSPASAASVPCRPPAPPVSAPLPTCAARLVPTFPSEPAPDCVTLTAYHGRNSDPARSAAPSEDTSRPYRERSPVIPLTIGATGTAHEDRPRCCPDVLARGCREQILDRCVRLGEPALAVRFIRIRSSEHRGGDAVALGQPRGDLRTGGGRLRGHARARRLVDHAAHGGVDRLREEQLEPRRVERRELLGIAAGRSEKPAGDGDTVERAAQRREPVRRPHPALCPQRLDRAPAALSAGRDPHRVAAGQQLAGEPPPATAPADDQDPRHGGAC